MDLYNCHHACFSCIYFTGNHPGSIMVPFVKMTEAVTYLPYFNGYNNWSDCLWVETLMYKLFIWLIDCVKDRP